MGRTVRPAEQPDWPELWPLLVGMGAPDDEQSTRSRFERLRDDPQWLIVVVTEAGRFLGYAAAQDYGDHLRGGRAGRVARLHDLYVEPARRRTGVGRVLMDAVVEWAATRVGYLQWQAHESRAAPFYEQLGYRGQPCPQPDYPSSRSPSEGRPRFLGMKGPCSHPMGAMAPSCKGAAARAACRRTL